MAADADVNKIEKWAATGDVDANFAGLTRATGWPASYSTPGGDVPTRGQFNEHFRELTAAAVELNTRGDLQWHADVSYAHPARVARNGAQYNSVQDSQGQDPATDSTGAYWVSALTPAATAEEAQFGSATDKYVSPSALNRAVSGNTVQAYRIAVNHESGEIAASLDDPQFVSFRNVRGAPPLAQVELPPNQYSPPYLVVDPIPAGTLAVPRYAYAGGVFESLRLHPAGPARYRNGAAIYCYWTGAEWSFSPVILNDSAFQWGEALFVTGSATSGRYDVELFRGAWSQRHAAVAYLERILDAYNLLPRSTAVADESLKLATHEAIYNVGTGSRRVERLGYFDVPVVAVCRYSSNQSFAMANPGPGTGAIGTLHTLDASTGALTEIGDANGAFGPSGRPSGEPWALFRDGSDLRLLARGSVTDALTIWTVDRAAGTLSNATAVTGGPGGEFFDVGDHYSADNPYTLHLLSNGNLRLGRLNGGTGAITSIGAERSIPGTLMPVGLGQRTTNQALYACIVVDEEPKLYSVDKTSGALTELGDIAPIVSGRLF